jgi:hypothetical protein
MGWPKYSRRALVATSRRGVHNRPVARTYTRAEADEILRRALAEQASDGVHHDDLVAAAREVGIPETAIESAVSQLGEHREVIDRVAKLRAEKRRAFVRHLLSFMIVNGGIFLFDRFDGGPWFFHYVLIVWGIVLLLLGIRQLAPDQTSLTKKAERELEKERRRAEKQRRQTARASGKPLGPGAAKEFETAVEEGVNAMLAVAAKAIRGITPDARRYRAEEPVEEDEVRPTDEASASRRARSRRL